LIISFSGGHSLLTLDDDLYRTAFPDLTVSPSSAASQLLSSDAQWHGMRNKA
jgi:hypothetical protein